MRSTGQITQEHVIDRARVQHVRERIFGRAWLQPWQLQNLLEKALAPEVSFRSGPSKSRPRRLKPFGLPSLMAQLKLCPSGIARSSWHYVVIFAARLKLCPSGIARSAWRYVVIFAAQLRLCHSGIVTSLQLLKVCSSKPKVEVPDKAEAAWAF